MNRSTEPRQVEFITYRDGNIRVVHEAPLDPMDSFYTATDKVRAYLHDGDRYKIFACGLHEMIPPQDFAQHPDSAALRDQAHAQIAKGLLELGSIEHLGDRDSKACPKSEFSL